MINKSVVRIRVFAILAVLASSIVPAVQATPVTWVTKGLNFTDGSFLVGGITYDAATNIYSDSRIFAFGGSAFDNVEYSYGNPRLPVTPDFIALVSSLPSGDLTGRPALWINFDSPLDVATVSVGLAVPAIQALCADATCSAPDPSTIVMAFTGELFSTSVPGAPEPSTLLMLTAALLAFAVWRSARYRRGERKKLPAAQVVPHKLRPACWCKLKAGCTTG